MIPILFLVFITGLLIGWYIKDYKWAKYARTGKIMVVDGEMYKVTKYSETHGGGVEQ